MSTCYSCSGKIYYEDTSAACGGCGEIFHPSCLSEEGEDGGLCTACGQLCIHCNMIVRIWDSAHVCSN